MIYAYRCSNCGKFHEYSMSLESYVGFSPECPHCKSKNIHRSYGNLNFHLKGTGWGKETHE